VTTIMTSFGALRSHRSGLCAIALAGALLALPGAAGAAVSGCKVSNESAHTRHHSLQAAVDSAAAGDQLRVAGVCVGSTVVDRDLVIRGVRAASSGQPILDGGHAGRVLQIRRGAIVDVADLMIRHGRAGSGFGGGILNRGRLTLNDVVVVGNRADTGGGIYSTGRLELNGSTSIQHNRATVDDGGGVAVEGGRLFMGDASTIHDNDAARGGGGLYGVNARMTLDGTSSVHDNQATTGGGGIYVDFSATLVLGGSSTVDHNVAEVNGGGVFDNSSLTMTGSSAIADNVAGKRGGGVYVDCSGESTGVVPGGNVHGNHPSNRAAATGCP